MHIPAPFRARPKRAFAASAIVAAGALLLAGCAPASPAAPPDAPSAELLDGGTLNIGIGADPGNLDPALAVTLSSSVIYESMCDKLFNADSTGAVFPQLAAEPAVLADDGLSAEVRLREGVIFADGTPFDASAVAFSIERFQELPGSQRAADLRPISEVEVVDEHTVVLHFSTPMPEGALYEKIAGRAGIQVSPTAVAELGDEGFAEAPVCVGPFKFESRIAQDSVTLVKDPGYFRADEVHLDEVVYRILPDSSVRTTNLRSGDLQVVHRVSPTDLAVLEADDSIAVQTYPSQGHDYIEFNMGNTDGAESPAGVVDTPWAQNPLVREAFQAAIDREALNTVVYGGAFEPACGFIAPQSPLSTPALQECSAHDPELAAELLEESGVAVPVRGSVTFSNSPEFRRMAELIQQMAGEAGFELELNPQESTASIELVQSGDFELYLGTWTGFLDPTISRFVRSDDPSNWARYANPDVDRLLDEAGSTLDQSERSGVYEEIDAILRKDLPMVFLVRPGHIVAYSEEIAGLDFRATGSPSPAFAGFVAE
ncbi:ABC transporter substrate-binding protein [Agromyces mediolanus]|uniref:ABC transporter substrate-binding protein n=1 Tax=Agromyces mediolanus TaxID=41986 RepID=UPI00203C3498|nr:ABC transporter substrate-binding protein [Agromyces mediolanus]MCM3657777.1 ABC transporter substrate-binding protein [Agromyces mediolanus]